MLSSTFVICVAVHTCTFSLMIVVVCVTMVSCVPIKFDCRKTLSTVSTCVMYSSQVTDIVFFCLFSRWSLPEAFEFSDFELFTTNS